MGLGSTLHTAGAPARAVWSGAGAFAERLDRVLSAVEQLARSIKSIEDDMRGMRSDLREVNEGIEGLRTTVVHLEGWVAGIRDATVAIDGRVDGLERTLEAVDELARSVPRFGRKQKSPRVAAQPGDASA